MSAYCPEACPDADACVVGLPCAGPPPRGGIPTVVSPEAAALDEAYTKAKRLGPMPVPHVDRDQAVEVWSLIMKGLL